MATKRRFEQLRPVILKALLTGQKTVNELSVKTKINWRTVDKHIIYLIGRGFVSPVFVSSYVKIFQITEAGREALARGVVR